MDETSEFESQMSVLEKKLESIRRQNEMSRLNSEITLLERQLGMYEMQDGSISGLPKPTQKVQFDTKPKVMFQSTPKKEQTKVNTGASAPPFLTPQVGNIPMMSKVKDEVIPKHEFQPLTSTPKPKDAETKVGTPFMKSNSGAKIKPATYDGTVHWTDFKAHFDACAELNGWTDKEKGLY